MVNFITLLVALIFYVILFSAFQFVGFCVCTFIFNFTKEVYHKLKERYKDQTSSIFKRK